MEEYTFWCVTFHRIQQMFVQSHKMSKKIFMFKMLNSCINFWFHPLSKFHGNLSCSYNNQNLQNILLISCVT